MKKKLRQNDFLIIPGYNLFRNSLFFKIRFNLKHLFNQFFILKF